MPARIIDTSVSRSAQAGPAVAISLVLRKESNLDLANCYQPVIVNVGGSRHSDYVFVELQF